MKKSFMTRVLAMGLSTAMAFSVPVVGNFTTAFADTPASSSAALAMSYTQKDAEVGTRMVFSLKGSQASKWKVVRAASSDKAVAAIAKTTSKKVAVEAQGAGAAKVSVRVRKTKDKREKVLKIRLNITAADSTITSVEQTEAKKLVATLSKPVESVAAADFAVTRNDEAKTVIPVTAATLDADKTHVTIETETDMMDGQVYTVTYTAATKDKMVSTAQFTAKTVEKAVLTDVKLTATNGFKATFSADASKDITKESFEVKTVDGAFTPAVESVNFAEDGLTADVVLSDQMYQSTYNVKVGDVTKELKVEFGDVTAAEIVTTTAEKDKATKIEFKLYDAAGVDVTDVSKADERVTLSVDGAYIFDNQKATNAKITMNTVGDVATVTLTYNPLNGTAATVKKEGKITCVASAPVESKNEFFTIQKAQEADVLPRFYSKTFKADDIMYENEEDRVAYFAATDESGKAISYDSYEISSSNDSVLLAAEDKVSAGKYATATLTPVKAGVAQLIIKATKNGASKTFAKTVTVRAAKVPTKITTSTPGLTISTHENGLLGPEKSFKVFVLDQYGNKMDAEVNAQSANPGYVNVKQSTVKSDSDVVVLPGVDVKADGSRTSITVSTVGQNGETLRTAVNVTVKDPEQIDNRQTQYALELSKTNVDLADYMGDPESCNIEVRLVCKKDGYFDHYVEATSLSSITVRKGSMYYGNNMFEKVSRAAITASAIHPVGFKTDGVIKLNLVKTSNAIHLVPKTSVSQSAILACVQKGNILNGLGVDNNYDEGIAESGIYDLSVVYGTNTYTARFVVANSIEIPTIKFDKTSTNVSTLLGGLKDCATCSVDLIQPDDTSIIGVIVSFNNELTTSLETSVGKKSMRYAVVQETFGRYNYYHYVPLATTLTFD